MAWDIKIVGGMVVDGTGAAPVRADVAIEGGRIAEVGACSGDAAKVIDAKGALVTPGFVDIHTHFDGQVSWDQELAPSCFHGVTTAVMGNCGVGFAPCRAADRDQLIDLMQGVEDIPGTALSEGMSWDWETFPEYMDAIDRLPHAIDFAVQIPHDALRVFVMGQRALAHSDATDADIAQMRSLVREALEAGAAGFSTGRTDGHRAVDGSFTPSSEADVRELAGIAGAFDGLDHGLLQAVSDFDIRHGRAGFDAEFDVLEAMAKAAPDHGMSISLLQRIKDTSQWKRVLERVESCEAAGLSMRVQVAARGIGILLGLEATFHPFMGFPSFQRIAELPLAEQVAAMRDPAFKAQLLSETSESVAGDGSQIPALADELLANIEFISMRMWRLGDTFDYEPAPTESLLAKAQERGVGALEVIYDAMLEDDGKELLYFPIYNYLPMDLSDVEQMIRHPLALAGLSDAGAHVGTICDASFPTYMLSHWTKGRKRGDTLPVQDVVQMLSQRNAAWMGMRDRGVLAPGMRADINVIDMEALRLQKPYIVRDLPAGGKRMLQRASGYRATLVAGEVVIADGELTDARPGRLVRLGRSRTKEVKRKGGRATDRLEEGVLPKV